MTMQSKPPRIVAELGRPETPEETAARKAETSRNHRANQTALNLVVALVASLAIVLFLVVVVVRPAAAPADPIDYSAVASQTGQPLVAPVLPPEWGANDARYTSQDNSPDGVTRWYIGFITPETQFIALEQGLDTNPTWLSAVLERAVETGTTTIDGLDWTVYDQRDTDDPGNFAYSMSAALPTGTIVLHGTASEAEFEQLATAIAAEVR